MSFRIAYDVDGLEAVEHELLGIQTRLIETRPLLELFADQLREMEGTLFDNEGLGQWEELAPYTIWKKGHSIIGRDTEALVDSLTEKGAEGSVEEFYDDELVFGTSVVSDEGYPYPIRFNEGGENPHQPARPLFDFRDQDLRRFTKMIQVYVRTREGRAGFGSSTVSAHSLGLE